ncbi:hypothetical protein GRI89_09415 [Altererythrobacter salegens]|uniref:Uncharacterized protein n=1 Tax=Croceibacterium salegens TaxID=1737568 RepID=A0A6I4SY28_9SPHN|nr:hypothetical protein [Croceibacterium salegens]MXO59756.1 hypothetical protein [Croceibacterium salegens]
MALRLGIPVLAAAAAAALVAGPTQARTVGSWEVGRTAPDACMMSAIFGSGESTVTLALLWHASEGRLEMLAAGRGWKDLRAREGDTASLEFNFDGQVQYSQWLSERATFSSMGVGVDGIVGDWGTEHSGDLAKAVTGSKNVNVKIGNTDLGAFDLSGADAAYRELLRCGESA